MAPNPANLRASMIYYTECALATVEGLRLKKSTSKSELRRHQTIADGMVEVCRALPLITDYEVRQVGAPRLLRLMWQDN